MALKPNIPDIQQQINAAVINREVCNALPINFGRLVESQVCAGNLGAGAGVCLANRGGLLFCNGQISGVLVNGFACGAANNPGIYTQLRFYNAWLDQQLRRDDVPPANSNPIEPLP